MPLSSQAIAEARKVYETFWDSYLTGNIEAFAACIDDAFSIIGTSEGEVSFGKEAVAAMYEPQFEEIVGKAEPRNRQVREIPTGDMVQIIEFSDIYVLIDSEWSFYSKFRLSTLLHQTPDGWKLLQQHGSLPDMRVGENETVAIDKISKENLELRDAVKRRTAELESKNRELEIEAALERVRSRSMAMQKSHELKEVIQLIYQQLIELGIHTEHAGIILDYKERDDMHIWLADGLGSPSELTIPYFDCPHWNGFVEAKKNGLQFFAVNHNKAQKDDFYQKLYQFVPEISDAAKRTIFEYKGLAISTALLDDVALYIENFDGIPYSDADNEILFKFGKVFQQTYTRFRDLQKAEKQAREAQIELALERIRAQVTAMQKSSDLLDIVVTMRAEFVKLGHEAHYFWHMRWLPETYAKAMTSGDGTKIGMVMSLPRRIHGDIKAVADWEKGSEPVHVLAMDAETAVDYIHKMVTWGDFERVDPQAPTLDDIRHIGGLTFVMARTTHGEIGYSLPGVVTDPPKDAVDTLVRFAGVFDLAYKRFEDLKATERQTREARIELALEKVRSRSLAMHNSDELNDVVSIVFEKIKELNIPATAVGIGIPISGSKDLSSYVCGENEDGLVITHYRLPYFDNVISEDLVTALEEQKAYYVGYYSREEKNAFYKHLFEHSAIKDVPEDIKQMIFDSPRYTISMMAVKNALWNINDFEGKVLSESDIDIIKRFARVFEQAYTRFLDLQKAEAQAREAKIETALEKVRSRTMGMQKSDELADVANVLFEEMNGLVHNLWTCGFVLCEKDRKEDEWWLSQENGFSHGLFLPNVNDYAHKTLYEGWLQGEAFRSVQLEGDKLQAHYDWLMEIPVAKSIFDDLEAAGMQRPDWQKLHAAYFSKGYLVIITREPCPEEAIFKRFAQVFDLTYTRFLDLQKAEAQAREAQIENALEKVRSRSLAMHKSEELNEVVKVLFEKMTELDIPSTAVGIQTFSEDSKDMQCFVCGDVGTGMVINQYLLPYFDHPILNDYIGAHEKGLDHYVGTYSKEVKDSLYEVVLGLTELKDIPAEVKAMIRESVFYEITMVPAKKSTLAVNDFHGNPLSKSQIAILKRFAKVFDQAYTRFLDLQKAEAQAREAQIANALEKVRSRSLAMQSPDELIEVAQLLREEMGALGVEELETSSIYIHDEKSGKTQCWFTIKNSDSGKAVTDRMIIDLGDTWVGQQMLDFHKSNEKQTSILMQGAQRTEWINYCGKKSNAFTPEGFYGDTIPERTYHLYKFSDGYIGAASPGEISSESWDLLKRATSVFSFAYTRFLDLQKAETRAREARIELALERIRAQVASMQESSDLFDIVVGMRNEFLALGHEADYFWHMRWLAESYEMSMTSEDGSRIGMVISLPKFVHDEIPGLAEWERSDDPIYVLALNPEGAWSYIENMNTHGSYELADPNAPGKEDIAQIGGLTFIMARTTHGEIGYGLPGMVPRPPQDALDTLVRFAGVFDLAYKRFEDLQTAEKDLIEIKAAKAKAEKALAELKSAQDQLIQAEKLASLGQLTAGIAHEIKNPLNFVNNFSELSVELIDEVFDELTKLKSSESKELIVEILQDVKSNLSKVYEHGSRADGIVKSMLQHSRGGSGKREPTDLNAMIKEYTNLAFHGMRAGKKPINVEIDLQLDPHVGSVDLIAEDFSRVLLNLVNNAFDAMRETESKRTPKLTVRTAKTSEVLTIEVVDNGSGIPEAIRDKILQPFFTTKKGTEGTGLGLSITNDIVKAHGGELKIESTTNEGTAFTIVLPSKAKV